MGKLVDGKWTTAWYDADEEGRFKRDATVFQDRVTQNSGAKFLPESGRYHLYVSLACPWAHRTLIARHLLGLEDAIGVSIVDWFMGDDGWTFQQRDGATGDRLGGKKFLRDVYTAAAPDYTGRVTVPILWDTKHSTIVCNESRIILEVLAKEFFTIAKSKHYDLYPRDIETDINDEIDRNYDTINNGVYRAGFATSQQAYNEAYGDLFKALDRVEETLASRRFLCGDKLTAADICLFTTLIRFDAVYHGHFKCNKRLIRDHPNLARYTAEIYQLEDIAGTVNFNHIKKHYYVSHTQINPTQIVPAGPVLDYLNPNRDL